MSIEFLMVAIICLFVVSIHNGMRLDKLKKLTTKLEERVNSLEIPSRSERVRKTINDHRDKMEAARIAEAEADKMEEARIAKQHYMSILAEADQDDDGASDG